MLNDLRIELFIIYSILIIHIQQGISRKSIQYFCKATINTCTFLCNLFLFLTSPNLVKPNTANKEVNG